MRGRGWVGGYLSLSLLLLAFGSVAAAEPVSVSCEGRITTRGPWTRIEVPLRIVDYSHGNGYAVDPRDPDRILAAGEQEVVLSEDGGCTWRTIYVPDTLNNIPGAHQVYVRQPVFAGPDGGTILLLTQPKAGGIITDADLPQLIASHDDGRTWSRSEEGLLGVGRLDQMAVAPGDPGTVYLTTFVTEVRNFYLPHDDERATLVYRSTDGGRSWELRNTGSAHVAEARLRSGFGAVRKMAVDPGNADSVWLATNTGLYRSTDGGGTWIGKVTEKDVGPIDVHGLDIGESDDGSRTVTAVDSRGNVYTSKDPSHSFWSRGAVAGLGTQYPYTISVAHGSEDATVASSIKGVYRRVSDTTWAAIDPRPPMIVTDLSSDQAPNPSLYGVEMPGKSLVRYDPPTGSFGGRLGILSTDFSVGQPEDSLPDLSAAAPLKKPDPATLTPARKRIELSPGETTSVPHELLLPPHPSPVEVYFLLDTTQSMYGAILGLQDGLPRIIAELRRQGIDLWAGLGEFRTYPGEDDTQNFPYRRDRAIGPIDQQLASAIENLEGGGNSGANLTALLQAATGTGQDVAPPGPSRADVVADMEAGFGARPHALRVVMHFADRYFNAPGRDTGSDGGWTPGLPWPGPLFDEAIAALNGQNIEHIGIHMSPPNGDVRRDMQTVSMGTETLVPAGSKIDCNGDGLPELSPGNPMVCGLESDRAYKDARLVAGTVVALIESLRDETTVSFREVGDSGVVTSIEPQSYEQVDLKSLNRLPIEVAYACRPTDAGRTVEVEIAAVMRERNIATASTKVVCGVVDPLPPPDIPDAPVGPAIVIPPVVPPPAPLPAPGPGPVQAVQMGQAPANAPASQPHPVAVPQKQQQPQVALVRAAQQVREQMGMEYAMTATRSRRDPLAATKIGLGVGALALMIAYGYSLATVRSVRQQRVGRRPRD